MDTAKLAVQEELFNIDAVEEELMDIGVVFEELLDIVEVEKYSVVEVETDSTVAMNEAHSCMDDTAKIHKYMPDFAAAGMLLLRYSVVAVVLTLALVSIPADVLILAPVSIVLFA